IAGLDDKLNKASETFEQRRRAGVVALILLLGATLAVTVAIVFACRLLGALGVIPLAVAASSLIAQRSLFDHVERVATA
ncbi:hypothetical protein ABTK11_22475, partial [Acinetobacter baumannii]